MGAQLGQLALVAVLVLVNAALSGSEMALVTLREGQVRQLGRRSRSGERLARLVRDPNRYLATIQLGITLAGFLASAAAAVSLSEPLVGPLGFLGGAARGAAVVLVTVLLTFVTLVVGELAPKRLAMQRAERWGWSAPGRWTCWPGCRGRRSGCSARPPTWWCGSPAGTPAPAVRR